MFRKEELVIDWYTFQKDFILNKAEDASRRCYACLFLCLKLTFFCNINFLFSLSFPSFHCYFPSRSILNFKFVISVNNKRKRSGDWQGIRYFTKDNGT